MPAESKHWNTLYAKTEDTQLGWYEEEPLPTQQLLQLIPERKGKTALLPGAGTSLLVEKLLDDGMQLIINDISSQALDRLKTRLQDQQKKITWLCQDISRPLTTKLPTIDLWIDRAVLHFLTDEAAITRYFTTVQSRLQTGGYALFAEFSQTGAPKCAGLTLHRYSLEELSTRLGSSFELISSFDHTYHNPNGDPRPYIYALFIKR